MLSIKFSLFNPDSGCCQPNARWKMQVLAGGVNRISDAIKTAYMSAITMLFIISERNRRLVTPGNQWPFVAGNWLKSYRYFNSGIALIASDSIEYEIQKQFQKPARRCGG
jgi:hypothetical protein